MNPQQPNITEKPGFSNLTEIIKRLVYSANFWLALAVVAFIAQSAYNLFNVRTWFDEANYAYKGYMAVKEVYPLYGKNGPWFEYMPLAFLIPGVIFLMTGPSFYVARLFSILCAALTFYAAYRIARKLSGVQAAVITLWLLVGGLVSMRYYATISPYSWVTLPLMLCLLSMMSDRFKSPMREIIAIFFATIAVLIRQNMLVTYGVIVLFCLVSQKRLRDVAVILLATVAFPGLIIFVYWPGIIDHVLTGLPFVGSYFRELIHFEIFNIKSPLRPWTKEKFWEGMEWYAFHLPLISAYCVAVYWGVKLWLKDKLHYKGLLENRFTVLIGFIFIVNLIVHTIGPQAFCTRCPAVYYNYFSPFGAIAGGIGIAAILKSCGSKCCQTVIISVLIIAIVLVSTLTRARTFPLSPPQFNKIAKAAEQLATLTTPDDKIFVIADPHVMFLAERYTIFPALMNHEYTFVVTDDLHIDIKNDKNKSMSYVLPDNTATVEKARRWNYKLAERWLKEADVVVLSDERIRNLANLYTGLKGSGKDVQTLIYTTLINDFEPKITIPCSHGGDLYFYRRHR